MQTPEDYILQIPEERREPIQQLRSSIKDNLPIGFEETIIYNMIGYVVPKSHYPGGYHCDPSQPLPFINLASQKSHIAVYHMGIYSDPSLKEWFESEYPKYCKRKLNMGKSCIRFKNPKDIPYDLIGQLASKMTPDEWIELYENNYKKK